MTIQLYSRLHEPIPLSPQITRRYKQNMIDRTEKWVAQDGENDFLFQEVPGPGFILRFLKFVIRNPRTYILETSGNICLQVSLEGVLDYNLTGFAKSISVFHRQFNMFYSPSVSFKYKSERFYGKFSCCEIWLTKEFLQPFTENYNSAAAFASSINLGMPVQLFQRSQYCDVEMMALQDLFTLNKQEPEGDPTWLTVYVVRFLQKVFEPRNVAKTIKLKPDFINRIYNTVELLNDMDDYRSKINLVAGTTSISPRALGKMVRKRKISIKSDDWRLDDLATFSEMTSYQLRKGFKQLYNRTVLQYIRDVQWQWTLTMLASRSYTLKQIAYFAGFNSQANFSREFKKRFGRTPLEFLHELRDIFKNYKK